MSTSTLKNKIYKSLERMDDRQLQSAYQIFKEFESQQDSTNIKIDKILVKKKIAKGIIQLDNNEGSDFITFLNKMNSKYSSEK